MKCSDYSRYFESNSRLRTYQVAEARDRESDPSWASFVFCSNSGRSTILVLQFGLSVAMSEV